MRTNLWQRWAGLAAAALTAAGFGLCGHAAAELLSSYFPEGVPGYDAAPGVTVLSRSHPDFDPLGIRMGAFMLRPRLETSIGYDDNVLAGGQRRGSWMARTQPSLLFGSDWSRHALGGYVSLSDTRYPGVPAQGRTDETVSLGGALDIGRDHLTLAAAHVSQHQDRSGLDAVPADKPVPVTVDDVRASYDASFGRWTLTPNMEASSWRFGSATILGLPASQAFRDRNVLQGGVTTRYEWAPSRNLLLVTRALSQGYPNPVPGQAKQDSIGYQLLAGLDYNRDEVWRYRVLLGGETRRFAAFRSHDSLIFEAETIWSPSALTTVRGSLSRAIEDAAQEGVAGFTATSARLGVDHEYFRNVILSAAVGLQRAAFLESGGTQNRYTVGFGVTWLVDRSIRISAAYDMSSVTGSRSQAGGVTGDYDRRLALITLRLGL
jgi:hypothetical protein